MYYKTIIPLNKKWRIAADKYQWILQKKQKLKSRKTRDEYEEWHNEGYFPKIEQAVNECFQRSLRTSGVESLEELKDYADELRIELKSMIEPVLEEE